MNIKLVTFKGQPMTLFFLNLLSCLSAGIHSAYVYDACGCQAQRGMSGSRPPGPVEGNGDAHTHTAWAGMGSGEGGPGVFVGAKLCSWRLSETATGKLFWSQLREQQSSRVLAWTYLISTVSAISKLCQRSTAQGCLYVCWRRTPQSLCMDQRPGCYPPPASLLGLWLFTPH